MEVSDGFGNKFKVENKVIFVHRAFGEDDEVRNACKDGWIVLSITPGTDQTFAVLLQKQTVIEVMKVDDTGTPVFDTSEN